MSLQEFKFSNPLEGLTESEKETVIQCAEWLDNNKDHVDSLWIGNVSKVLQKKGKKVFWAEMEDGEPVIYMYDNFDGEGEYKGDDEDFLNCALGVGKVGFVLAMMNNIGGGKNNLEQVIKRVAKEIVFKSILESSGGLVLEYDEPDFFKSCDTMEQISIKEHMNVKAHVEKMLS